VVTIFVVLVVCGEFSNYSTHLSLLRRFSSLNACFCINESFADSFPTYFPLSCDADFRSGAYFLSSSSARDSSRWTLSLRSASWDCLAFNYALNYVVSLVSYSLSILSHLSSIATTASVSIYIIYYGLFY
jgi:hypothetical protein